jgi:hypothetical protein
VQQPKNNLFGARALFCSDTTFPYLTRILHGYVARPGV